MEKQDMEQMMEFLLKMEADRKADRKAWQEKEDADLKVWREKMATERGPIEAETEKIKARTRAIRENMQAYEAKTNAVSPAMQVTETSRKKTAAIIGPETEVKTMACQEMEAHQEEEKPTSADWKPEAAKKRKAPVDDAEVMPVREPKKKRRRDRKLAAEHHRQKTNTSTRENCTPRKDWP
jgi:hypothetical protein